MPALSFDYINRNTKNTICLPVSVFKKPVNDEEYALLEGVFDKLLDEVRDDENHPLALAMQIIGENLERFDNEHYPAIGADITEIEMVKYLMKTHGLYQKDLADIFGGQANVSKFLNAERALNKAHIAALKKRFNISADFFIRIHGVGVN